MKRLAVVLILAGWACSSAAAAAPPVVTRTSPIRIWVDQIGYRTAGPKLAVVASDTALPDGLQIELCDAQTDAVAWKLTDHPTALTKFANGNKDKESGEFLDHLDFSSFSIPGRYYLALTAPNNLRSYQFNLADNPYYAAGVAAWKAYYYNRADGEKPEKYAGLWSHGKAFMGPGQATEAQVYAWDGKNGWPGKIGTEVIDPKTYDVHGGWWDAGDMNKYTSNTVNTQNMLLMAYEMCPTGSRGPKDNELNIPESGNGVPDALKEIRFQTEFLIRDHDGTGAAFGRVHMANVEAVPPDAVKSPVQLTRPNSAATMARACGLAYAALVWRQSKFDDAFGKLCLGESERSWNLLKTKPHPWPVDPKNPNKILDQKEMGGHDKDYALWRATAAACYFSLTGEKEYDEIVHQYFAGGDATEPYKWVYLRAKGADPALVSKIKAAIQDRASGLLSQIKNGRGYLMAVDGYGWGSNGWFVGRNGGTLTLAAQLTDDPARKQACLNGAEEYVHYLFGRNPLGTCYFSNMRSFGAEHSVMVMFHSWVGNNGKPAGAKYIGEGEGKIGPFPGFVIGGPNKEGGINSPDVPMKHLVEDLDWRHNSYQWLEPDIIYQSDVLRLLDTFTWPAS